VKGGSGSQRGFANAAQVKAVLEEQHPISEAAANPQTSEQ
jgi:hypothetical protein